MATNPLEIMRNNMLAFGKITMPNMFEVKSPSFHGEIVRNLRDKEVKKLNIIAPRGHGKSSLVGCILPLHHLMFDKGPKFIVLVSKTEGHAVRLLDTIKSVLNYSEPFRRFFGYHGQMNAQVWKTTEIVLDTGDAITTRGTGQQVVGLKHINQRPTMIILDDPEDMNNTKTDEAMEFNLRWMMQSLYPSLDPIDGRIIVIGTPQHQRCIVETLRTAEGWKTLKYKALQDDGSVLWPEWFSRTKLMEEKATAESMGRVSMFYREFQCEVIGDEDQLFKAKDIRRYMGTLSFDKDKNAFLSLTMMDNQPVVRKIPVNIFMGIDPASSVNLNADYSAIIPIAVDGEKNRFVLPYFRQRVTPLTLADRIIEFYHRYYPQKTRIEATGYQEMLREYLRSKQYIPGLEIKELPRTSKSVRLESMQPFFAMGRVFLQPNMMELEDELLMYPRGRHDDLLDALFYATKNVFTPVHEDEKPVMMSEHIKYFVGLAEDEDQDEDQQHVYINGRYGRYADIRRYERN